MPLYIADTTEGRIGYVARRQPARTIMIHGFGRKPSTLFPWLDLIPDLGFLQLPGHGAAARFRETSLESWIRGLGQLLATLPEPPLIIAESLGAIIGLSLPARAVIAVEPPLSVDQLWPLHQSIARARARGVEIDPAVENLFEKPFHWVLDRISAPTLVLAGQEPLMPPRDIMREPSLLTDEDFAAYAAHPLVEAHRIPGGHTLLDHSREAVMAASADFMARHGYLP